MQYTSLPSDLWCWPDFADLTPEDKYYLLYLHTNPHVAVCGCYALPRRIAAAESGYNEEIAERILSRLVEAGGWVDYDQASREILLLRWPDINPGWFVKNGNVYKSLCKSVPKIKSDRLRAAVQAWLLGEEPPPPQEGLTSPLQAPSEPPPSITHQHQLTSTQITSPSSLFDDDDSKKEDITPLLRQIPAAERLKITPKLLACLAAGHSLTDCQQAIDAARAGASPTLPWVGLAHHKLDQLAATAPLPPPPRRQTPPVLKDAEGSEGIVDTTAPWDMPGGCDAAA